MTSTGSTSSAPTVRSDGSGPADTRVMRIVHNALRRDLTRTVEVLHREPAPADEQRVAIAAHARWLMDFLHHHHTGEDDGLWPLVLGANPAATDLLDQMDDDHAAIGPEMDRVVATATAYGQQDSDEARQELVAAIESLRTVLDPHLRREEEEMMPVVSQSITDAQWIQWDQERNLAGKSKRQLGMEAHFILDGADRADFDKVCSLVPPVPRWVLLHAFARPYRRACAARWGADVDVRPLHLR